jgi:hypothetical protein
MRDWIGFISQVETCPRSTHLEFHGLLTSRSHVLSGYSAVPDRTETVQGSCQKSLRHRVLALTLWPLWESKSTISSSKPYRDSQYWYARMRTPNTSSYFTEIVQMSRELARCSHTWADSPDDARYRNNRF